MSTESEGWQKPSPYSVAVIVAVLGLLGFLAYVGKLTVTESIVGAVIGVITWVTKGARPAAADKIGAKRDDDDTSPPAGGASPLLFVVALACAFGITQAACTPALRQAIQESAADKARCAIRNQNLSNAEIIKKCLLEGASEDIERILALVGTAREESASAALVAAAVQRDLDQKAGVCRAEKAGQ